MMLKRSLGTGVAITTALAAACAKGPTAPDGLFFPTVPRSDAYPAAMLTATLAEQSGCLFASSGHDRWLLLWPEGYSARTAQDGRVEVLDEDQAVIGAVGETIEVGGGETNPVEVGGVAAADEWAERLTGGTIPPACGHLYWIVSPIAISTP
jgi:hypothetical protein